MRRRRFSRGGRSGRSLRPMDWGQALFPLCATQQQIDPCSAVAAYLIPPSVVRGSFTDPTLMTSLLYVSLEGLHTGAISYAGQLLFGLIDWDDINDSVPLDFPDPYNNGNLDWIGIGAIKIPNGPAQTYFGTSTIGERGDGMVQWNSRRRLGNDKGLLFSAYYWQPAAGDVGAANLSVYGRFLFKE